MFDENLNPAFNTSDGIAATQLMVDLVNKYKVCPPGTPTYDHAAMLNLYTQGHVAQITPWGNGVISADTAVAKTSRYDVPPVKSKVMSRTAGAAFTIPANAPHPDLAWEYIKWATSPDVRQKVVSLGAPTIKKSEMAYVKEGWNAWAVASVLARPDVGVNPSIPNLGQVSDAAATPISSALVGQISVSTALSQAEQAVKSAMKGI